MNIRTLEQAREGRVTVQIDAPADVFDDRTTVTITVPVAPSDSARASAQADEIARLKLELTRRVNQLDQVHGLAHNGEVDRALAGASAAGVLTSTIHEIRRVITPAT